MILNFTFFWLCSKVLVLLARIVDTPKPMEKERQVPDFESNRCHHEISEKLEEHRYQERRCLPVPAVYTCRLSPGLLENSLTCGPRHLLFPVLTFHQEKSWPGCFAQRDFLCTAPRLPFKQRFLDRISSLWASCKILQAFIRHSRICDHEYLLYSWKIKKIYIYIISRWNKMF